MKNQKISSEELLEKLNRIKYLITEVFSEKISSSYSQKIVYNLLNLVRAGDKEKFLWTLLRLINTRNEDNNAKKLVYLLNDIYSISLSKDMFEKWAFTVIMGIMFSNIHNIQEGGE